MDNDYENDTVIPENDTVQDIQAESDDEISEEFHGIIDRFCNNLALFAKYVKNPIEYQTHLIKRKIIHTSEFNLYVADVDSFNTIMRQIIELLKNIIIALNILFISKDKDSFVNFIESLHKFLLYLLNEDIFANLNRFKKKLNIKYKSDINVLNQITKLKSLIFSMFNISINITTLFIPQLCMVKEAVNILGEYIDDKLAAKKIMLENNNASIDDIINQLLNIQLRAQILVNIDNRSAFRHIIKLENKRLVNLTETLQVEYIQLVTIVDILRVEITDYKNKKKSIFDIIIQKLSF
jgi:hypothetical protein